MDEAVVVLEGLTLTDTLEETVDVLVPLLDAEVDRLEVIVLELVDEDVPVLEEVPVLELLEEPVEVLEAVAVFVPLVDEVDVAEPRADID